MKRSILLGVIFFTTLVANAFQSNSPNDNKTDAILISNLNNWCSDNAAYNNIGSTVDGSAGVCSNPSQGDVWFKFQANTKYIHINVKNFYPYGYMGPAQIVLRNSDGDPLQCAQLSANGTAVLEKTDMKVNYLYYITVSNWEGSTGTFTLCVREQLNFDSQAGAIELTQRNNWCSANAQYSNVNATADGLTGSCGAPNNNVWFKFQATTPYLKVNAKTGGLEGTIQYPEIALWTASDEEVICVNNNIATGDVSVEKTDLTVGQWYYLSIYTDNGGAGNEGTFSLCVNDQIPFDYKAGAIELTQRNNWCSANAQYSNVNATADGLSGGCGAPNNNVWFKFQATTPYLKVNVKTGELEGTIQYPEIALWTASGEEVICVNNNIAKGDVSVEKPDLTVGQWYYLSIYTDNGGAGNQGTFSLCVDDQIPFDYKAGAIELTQRNNWCSANAQYSNVNATADGLTGSCGAPNNNVWFKFQATTPYLKVNAKTGGLEGTIQYPEIAFWTASDEEVICVNNNIATGDVSVEKTDLTVGQWYYLSIYTVNGGAGNEGTFSLCVNDQIPFDYKAGAIELTQRTNWCSPTTYTNVNATNDGSSSLCGSPNSNVWFKFQASTPYIKLEVNPVNNNSSPLQYPEIALWDNSSTLVNCTNYVGSTSKVSLTVTDLILGQWYYVSVYNGLSGSGNQGDFTFCINDQKAPDSKANALTLTQKNNWCSSDAAYTTVGSTLDGSAATCGSMAGDVWFKFQAGTSYIKLDMKTGGSLGTLTRAYVILRDSTGGVLSCYASPTSTATATIEKSDLIIGNWYYLSITNATIGAAGSFSLCVTDQPSFNFQSGAVILTQTTNWCSSLASYSNAGATADGSATSCGAPNNNVWFKFQAATSYIKINVNTGSAEGTIQIPEIALWNSSGIALGCFNNTGSATSDAILENSNLTVGEWYYVSVYTSLGSSANQGTFTLCINDQISFDLKAGAIELTQRNDWCSASAAYSNAASSVDGTASSCGTSLGDVWFKFKATTSYLKMNVKTGSELGTMTRPQLVLRDNSGAPVICSKAATDNQLISVEQTTLTVGQWYYVTISHWSGIAGTFTICVNDQPGFDLKTGAIELVNKNDWCSDNALYTNVGSTVDGSFGTCGSYSGGDVWFKFQAATVRIQVEVKRGGAFGTLSLGHLILRNASGSAIACEKANTSAEQLLIEETDLTVGQWYYISVANSISTQGTFTLCIDDRLSNDFKDGAIELTNKSRWCSATSMYSNIQATTGANYSSSSCGVINKDVWFKFYAATAYVKVDVKLSGTSGDLMNAILVLRDGSGTYLQCNATASNIGIATVEKTDLTIGQWYYVQVGSPGAPYGSFTLCLTDQLSNNYKEGAIEITQRNNWCSNNSAFDNVGSTVDGTESSCGTSLGDVWFKFKAATPYIKVDVKTGIEGTMSDPLVVLWDNSGTSLLCNKISGSGIVTIEKQDLVVGNQYYFTVSNWSGSKGSFALCVEDLCHMPPDPFQLNYASSICSESATSLSLSGSQAGITYKINDDDSIIGTGQPITWNNLKEGEYTVTAARGTCRSLTLDIAYISQRAPIQEFIISKKTGKFCGQDTIVMSGSEYGVEYQLKRDNIDVGAPQSGNGPSIQWINLTLSGTYSVQATNTSFGCSYTMGQTVDVSCNYNQGRIGESVYVATTHNIPAYVKLAVEGDIIATGLNLKVPDKWPDYVFNPAYRLSSLNDVENYINENGHLPDVPSASEVNKKGSYSMTAIDAILLEKIEELTLYAIQLQKQLTSGNRTQGERTVGEDVDLTQWKSVEALDSETQHDNAAETELLNPSDLVNNKGRSHVAFADDPSAAVLTVSNARVAGALFIGQPRTVPSNYKLVVNGNIIATGLDIKAVENWPDYVFDEKYDLMNLNELEKFIKAKGHLPNMPSAVEMTATENYNLNQFDGKLLEKIEELTLYAIALSKRITRNDTTASWNFKSTQKFLFTSVLKQDDKIWTDYNKNSVDRMQVVAPVLTPFDQLTIAESMMVGTTTLPANYRLAVGGHMIAGKLDLRIPRRWPDYVFEKDYELMPLMKVDEFIERYGHLPSLLSAQEMAKKGDYNVAEMDMKLLEKIEELTLYMILINKELK